MGCQQGTDENDCKRTIQKVCHVFRWNQQKGNEKKWAIQLLCSQLVINCDDNCESFVCSQKHFKCPGYYCIPWRLVCHGVWDCPDGTEEKSFKLCNRTSCPGQFKCHNTSICISAESICDDIFDCNLADDEHFCYPLLPNCPENCICVLYIR